MNDYSTSSIVSSNNPTLREQIRASIEKYRVGSAKPDDPLATDKIKVARYLKRYGLTPADLPTGYWTFDEAKRGVILGETVGPIMAERRAAKRLARVMARGYPPDYLSQSRDDRRRTSAAVRQRRRRAKAAKPAPTPQEPRPIPFERVSREWRDDRLASLTAYTAASGARQRQLRGHEQQLIKAALLYQVLTAELHRAPSYGELAAKIGCTRDAARNTVLRLESLYGVTGPWRSKA